MKVMCIDGNCWWPKEHPKYLEMCTVTGEEGEGYYLAEYPDNYPYRWHKSKFIELPDDEIPIEIPEEEFV